MDDEEAVVEEKEPCATPVLTAEELHKLLLKSHLIGNRARRSFMKYLLAMECSRFYRELGFSSVAAYADRFFRLSHSLVYEYLEVARKLGELPLCDKVFKDEGLPYRCLRLIVKIATEETEAEWIAFARQKTWKQLEAEVKDALKKGRKRPRKNQNTLPAVTVLLSFALGPDEHDIVAKGLGKAASELSGSIGGGRIEPKDALLYAMRLLLETDPPGANRVGRPDSLNRILYHRCPECRRAFLPTPDGLVEIPGSVVDRIEPEAEKITIRPEEEERPASEPVPSGERTGPVPMDQRDRPNSRLIITKILARAGQVCENPFCRRQIGLQGHHIRWREDGGRTEIWNEAVACSLCHAALCQGLLTVEGDPLTGLKWTPRVDTLGITLADEVGSTAAAPEVRVVQAALEPENGRSLAGDVVEKGLKLSAAADSAAAGTSAAPPAAPPDLSVEAVEALPPEVSNGELRSVASRLEWNSQRRIFMYKARAEVVLPVPQGRLDPHGKHDPLRPERFADIVGLRRVVANLELVSRAARERGEAVGHVLLSGPAGLGKTTLARAMAAELGTSFRSVMGSALEEPHQLLPLLAELEPRSILFIDEVHRVKKECQDHLYTALEYGFMEIPIAQGTRVEPVRFNLNPFTLVAATTSAGMLTEPFRARFKTYEELDFYAEEDLALIVKGAAGRLGLAIRPDAAAAIACRSRGTPRGAVGLLSWARDIAQGSPKREIELAHVLEAAERQEIDEKGLGRVDRKILRLLAKAGRPMGIDSIAATLRLDRETLRSVHEPFLAERGHLIRTPRGRVLAG